MQRTKSTLTRATVAAVVTWLAACSNGGGGMDGTYADSQDPERENIRYTFKGDKVEVFKKHAFAPTELFEASYKVEDGKVKIAVGNDLSKVIPLNDSGCLAADGEPPACRTNEKRETGIVVTTASGLKYEVLKEGGGIRPAATDNVTVHYKGTLAQGAVFDSSYDRGKPADFPLNRVISGWTEGLQLMSVGSKYKFIIPPDLGYGTAGAGDKIPPNSTLVFEVELLKIN